jgi:hypothetical protein
LADEEKPVEAAVGEVLLAVSFATFFLRLGAYHEVVADPFTGAELNVVGSPEVLVSRELVLVNHGPVD